MGRQQPRAAGQPGPCYLQASCELSEDYFLTDDVLLTPTDTVIPFTSASGAAEAFVLSRGTPSHLHRRATAPGGWVYTVCAQPPNQICLAAAVSTDDDGTVTLAIIAEQSRSLETGLLFYEVGASGAWSPVGSRWWNGTQASVGVPLSVRGGQTPSGTTYFSTVIRNAGSACGRRRRPASRRRPSAVRSPRWTPSCCSGTRTAAGVPRWCSPAAR